MSDWLSEEIIFLEKKYHYLKAADDQIRELPLHNNFKALTELSVSQFAIFLRLVSENGVINHKNTRELLRFYSQHTQTRRVLNISPDSLYLNYYNASDADRQVVKSYIIKILNQLNNKLIMLIPLFYYFFDLDIDLDSLLILQNIF